MSAVERFVCVVTNAGVGRQEKGIGQIYAAIVRALHVLTLTINRKVGTVPQDAIELRIKYKLTDQPPAIVGERFFVGVFAREKFIVINIVAVIRPSQFVFELGGIILRKCLRYPFAE